MSGAPERIFAGATRIEALPGDARGFAYGDGLFETMRVHRGTVPWWARHMARLAEGAARLRMPLPDPALVEREALALVGASDAAILKLIVTRGASPRGYAPSPDAPPVWRLSLHALATPRETLVVRWCDTRLALQPALAGLKHCNRLEQILARGEWTDPAVDEGLMRSTEGDVVCATAANLFVLHGDRWTTPPVDRCGIAGTCRAWLLSETGAAEARLQPADIESADAVALCNAVRGILPVARLDARAWASHPAIATLRRSLARAHPGFTDGSTMEVA